MGVESSLHFDQVFVKISSSFVMEKHEFQSFGPTEMKKVNMKGSRFCSHSIACSTLILLPNIIPCVTIHLFNTSLTL